MKFPSKAQQTLPGIETALCACGCGQYFARAKQPNPARYCNPTHKKRAQRAREKARRSETRVKLTPKGWNYLQADSDFARSELWEWMDDCQRAIVALICETGYQPDQLESALQSLFYRD